MCRGFSRTHTCKGCMPFCFVSLQNYIFPPSWLLAQAVLARNDLSIHGSCVWSAHALRRVCISTGTCSVLVSVGKEGWKWYDQQAGQRHLLTTFGNGCKIEKNYFIALQILFAVIIVWRGPSTTAGKMLLYCVRFKGKIMEFFFHKS